MSEGNKKQISGKTTLSIECGHNQYKKILIENNCNAERVAYDFCKENNLDFDSMQMLTNKIKEIQMSLVASQNGRNKSKARSNNHKESFRKKSANTTINAISAPDDIKNMSQPKKTSRPSSNIVNYGERLYRKGMKLQEKTQRKINQKKKEIEKQNKEKYSFRPRINPVSFSVLYKRMTTHSACNDEDNIINYQTIKNKQIDELKSKHSSQSKEKYSFRPKINKNSLLIDKEKTYASSTISTRYNKLYNDNKKIKSHIDTLSKQFYDKNHLFKPKINTNFESTLSQMDFEQRQRYYKSKSKEKARKLEENVLTEEAKNNFQPEINEGYNSRYYTEDVFNDLYNKADYYRQKKISYINELYSSYGNKVKANDESNQILEKKKKNCFTELFHMMDKNGSGIITKSNLDMSKVPPHIKRIFERIVKELQEEDQSLNELEFVSVCFQLYDYLDYPDKKLFLDIKGKSNSKTKKDNSKIFTFRPQINKYHPTSRKSTEL